jgi:hypothetical protein
MARRNDVIYVPQNIWAMPPRGQEAADVQVACPVPVYLIPAVAR